MTTKRSKKVIQKTRILRFALPYMVEETKRKTAKIREELEQNFIIGFTRLFDRISIPKTDLLFFFQMIKIRIKLNLDLYIVIDKVGNTNHVG